MAQTEDGFKKFQYSKFDKDGGQLVIRTNDKEEFEELVGFTIKAYMEEQVIDEALSKAIPSSAPEERCSKCGTVKIMGRKGLYCKPCYVAWAEANKKGYKQY